MKSLIRVRVQLIKTIFFLLLEKALSKRKSAIIGKLSVQKKKNQPQGRSCPSLGVDSLPDI